MITNIEYVLDPPYMSAYQYQQLVKTDSTEAAAALRTTLQNIDGSVDPKLNRTFRLDLLTNLTY